MSYAPINTVYLPTTNANLESLGFRVYYPTNNLIFDWCFNAVPYVPYLGWRGCFRVLVHQCQGHLLPNHGPTDRASVLARTWLRVECLRLQHAKLRHDHFIHSTIDIKVWSTCCPQRSIHSHDAFTACHFPISPYP